MNFKSKKDASNYNGARIALLTLVIFSLLNIVILPIAQAKYYFLFSTYASLQLTLLACFRHYTFLYGAVISLIPYFLCWMLSKKYSVWMIIALIMFAFDSILFFGNITNGFIGGAWGFYAEVGVRGYIFIALSIGIKASLKNNRMTLLEKVQLAYENPSMTQGTREITVTRKKAFLGLASPMTVLVNDVEVCSLKNGESETITVPAEAFVLGAVFDMGGSNGEIMIPEVTTTTNYLLKPKAGLVVTSIQIVPAEN